MKKYFKRAVGSVDRSIIEDDYICGIGDRMIGLIQASVKAPSWRRRLNRME